MHHLAKLSYLRVTPLTNLTAISSCPFYFIKKAMSCFFQCALLLLSICDLKLITFSLGDLQSIIHAANVSTKFILLRLDVCFQSFFFTFLQTFFFSLKARRVYTEEALM